MGRVVWGMARKQGAILDLDGTVYREDRLLPGVDKGIDRLRSAGLELLFLTNSAVDSPEAIREKLSGFGIRVDADQILTSGEITADYLEESHPDSTPLVIGEETIRDAFEKRGIAPTDDPAEADILVVSLDRNINYGKLTKALRSLNEETLFLSTNPDRIRPGRDGPLPSTGAITGAVEGMTQRSPDCTLGKPSETATDVALRRLGTSAEECFIIGDRLDTDIAMGNAAGLTTVLIMSGVTTAKALENSPIQPNHTIESLANVPEILN